MMKDDLTPDALENKCVNFQIAKMNVINVQENARGNRLLASFTLVISSLRITNCVLIDKADGFAIANGPKGATIHGNPIHVSIIDEALQRAVTNRAAKMYEGHTGKALSVR